MAKSINEIQDEIIEEFEELEWTERYQLLIDYAKELALNPLPETDMIDQNKIEGCQSTVWLTAHLKDGLVYYQAESDALLVRGIVATLIHVLNAHTPQEILKANLYFIDRIGLQEHLTPMRSNGVLAMLKQMKLYALAFTAN